MPFVNFDANYYLGIAAHGYQGPVSRAFFPCLPLLIAAIHGLLHTVGFAVSYAVAGTVVTVACAYGALELLRRLLALDLGSRAADRFVWLLLALPYAFILLAPYSESVLLLSSVGSLLAARKQRWLLAGALGAVASACRLPGLIIVPTLIIEYLYQLRRGDQRGWAGLSGVALAPVGAMAYFAWLSLNGGIATYNRAYVIGWPDRKFSLNIFKPLYDPILSHVFHNSSVPATPPGTDALGLVSFAIVVLMLIWGWKRIRPSYRVYSLLSILTPLFTTITEGLGRYYFVIFPLILIGALFAREHRRIAIVAIAGSIITQLALATLFAAGQPGIT